MRKINHEVFEEIRSWMYRNARPIELARWKYHFEKGSKEEVISALSFYQNEDGGFGKALEADNWNPNSTPYTTLCALEILNEVDGIDMNQPMVQGIFRYLDSGAAFNQNGWLFNIESNNDYPHAPWWSFNQEANEVESVGVTAKLVSFILRFADRKSKLYQKALDISKQLIGKSIAECDLGDMGLEGYCVFADTIKQVGLVNQTVDQALSVTLKKLVKESIEKGSANWANYGVRPSNYIKSPDSVFYKDNEEIVLKEIEYLIDTKPENDVWGITWSWFDNNEKYSKEFAISENWWKANKAIEKLLFLKNFERVEF